MRALLIQQDHVSPAGPLGDALTGRGYEVEEFPVVPAERFHAPDVDVTFPEPTDFDVIVPMGAPWSVYDHATIGNWAPTEVAFLRTAHQRGVPVLGICFGGQALALALGGTVEPAPRPEIGWTRVRSRSPHLVEDGPWFQWHHDRWTEPPGSRTLARTAVAPQAFVLGRSLGLQFHPEMTLGMLRGWLGNGGDEHLRRFGLDPHDVVTRTRTEESAAVVRTHRLVGRFLDQVASS
jgi:GMP synthase-like glutamine amidotransferase